MRYLYRVDDDQLFAYAPNRRDFYLVSDDTLWAHESHAWLLSAASSATLLRRIAATYYDVVTGTALYYEGSEPLSRRERDRRAGRARSEATTNDAAEHGAITSLQCGDRLSNGGRASLRRAKRLRTNQVS